LVVYHRTKVAFMFLCCMKTVKEVYQSFKAVLTDIYAAPEIEAITTLVLTELTGRSNAQLKAFTDTRLNDEQQERLTFTLNQLATGNPVQYIIGHTDFYGLTFKVNPFVLIPRPETEELVDWVLHKLKATPQAQMLDVGTGSGCIPIAIKKNSPGSTVTSVDIDEDALNTARINAELNTVEVNLLKADALNLAGYAQLDKLYDLIVSNPPYVTQTDKQLMHRNVLDFEPHKALFVTNDEPLLFYNAIADFAVSHLKPGGCLFFEINEGYGQAMINMLHNKGFGNIELRQDMAGKDRMIRAAR
jgi:release factor glutamine methyltransferase